MLVHGLKLVCPHGEASAWRRTARAATVAVAVIAAVAAVAAPARAVNPVHATVVSDDPVNWTPHMLDGTVFRFASIGTRMYAGGSYTQVRNANSSTVLNRRFLIAMNRNTGLIDTGFNPTISGTVRTLVAAADGQSIYVGGSFSTVNGVTTRGVVRLNAATGAIWPGWNPVDIRGGVDELELLGNRLFVGGSFRSVGGATRAGLVALNAATGAADPFLNGIVLSEARITQSGATSPVKVIGLDVSPDGSKLVMIGNFNRVTDQPRYQLAVIDLTTNPATLHSWATDRYRPNCSKGFPTWMRGIDISADGSWMSIVTTGGAHGPDMLCDTTTRWELNRTGGRQQPTWVNHTGGDTLYSVAITGAAVYVGGHFRWLDNPFGSGDAGPGAVPREGIGAIHPVTGKALPWNPGKTRGVGTQDIFATAEGLWIGSDGSRVAGEFHGKIAFFPL